jgi:sulfite reductase beta subunit-like hemoprotein
VIHILGLLARSGHGKTTVARYLVDAFGAEVRSLAAPLKRAVQNVFGFSDAQIWGTQEEKAAIDPRYRVSPRWLLQRLGTEGLREQFGEDIHLRALLDTLRREEAARPVGASPRLYVVDDVRFPNDVRFVAAGGADYHGAVLKIVVSDAPTEPEHAAHASEIAIDDAREADIGATIVSARTEGVSSLLAKVDHVLRTAPAFAALGPALRGA